MNTALLFVVLCGVVAFGHNKGPLTENKLVKLIQEAELVEPNAKPLLVEYQRTFYKVKWVVLLAWGVVSKVENNNFDPIRFPTRKAISHTKSTIEDLNRISRKLRSVVFEVIPASETAILLQETSASVQVLMDILKMFKEIESDGEVSVAPNVRTYCDEESNQCGSIKWCTAGQHEACIIINLYDITGTPIAMDPYNPFPMRSFVDGSMFAANL